MKKLILVMIGILQRKNLLKRKPKTERKWRFFVATSKKDESGHWRYHIYLDGKLAKEEMTVKFWFNEQQEIQDIEKNNDYLL